MKAIITDLDRTLLHTDKSVSDDTVQVLNRCREKGIRILAASARPLRDLHRFYGYLGFDAITATNGAVVQLPDGIVERGLSRQSGEKILAELMRFPDLFLSMETSRGFYANRDIPQWEPVIYDDFPRLPEDCVLYKILASSKEKPLYEGVERILTEDAYYTIATNDLVQIMSREATKWSGIQKMLAWFEIDPKDTVFFGDDNDDIEPIQKCGLGVAVANAIPAVLQIADRVTGSNDEDGVARFIEKYIL